VILLLDTTVLIDILRGRARRRTLLTELIGEGHLLATAAINVGEVYAGMRPGEEARTDELLSNLECFLLTATIARRAGNLKSECQRRGQTLALADMIVAATAMEHGATLMTDNHKDFRPVPGLKLYSLS
jgi:predicted nucleic acid-binding protein